MNALRLIMLLSAAAVPTGPAVHPNQPFSVTFPATEARLVRMAIHASFGGQPCIDELEVYGPDGKRNLALASAGAKATASSCLPGYAIHQVAHLNDGRYGNSWSWIAAGTAGEWAQIELPRPTMVAKVVFSRDREGRYGDRVPVHFEILLSLDGEHWQSAATVNSPAPAAAVGREPGQTRPSPPRPLPRFGVDEAAPAEALRQGDLLRYALLCEARAWQQIDEVDPMSRTLQQTQRMIERLAAKGLDVTQERAELAELRRSRDRLMAADKADPAAERAALLAARLAKRRLFFRDPDLWAIEKVLFVKRYAYRPSHNYSVILDAQGGPGGAVCILEIPCRQGRLEPDRASVVRLFEARGGVARDPAASFDARRIYFGYRRSMQDYYHIMAINADGSDARQLTDGPFHDYFPCPLPDGGIALISTRCKARYLCWRPQAFVLFRMDADGENVRPLSYANVSEWAPSVMGDGRIAWTRSEYLDKGADFGHTLWAIRPDGTHPELIFGNNTLNCYANGREVPGMSEICCTLISHGGDLNGPIALLDAQKGRFNSQAVTNVTPDVQPHFHMSWAERECFRDPVPVSRDYFLCSHAPADQFGLYVIDRFGNRELLHLDPTIGSMCPTPFRAVAPPPTLPTAAGADDEQTALGQFVVADVYRGLESAVPRGTVKYLRVCQEVRADLVRLPNGEYQPDHEPFLEWYATPVHKVSGPHGWPSYVAKATWGIVPVEDDGSANFYAPAGKVLYFQVLDENYNELQRMRSVVQLQAGEKRSCIGCHEDRTMAPPVRQATALRREPSRLQPPPWGAGPFSYEKVVQPVWDAQCVRCHDAHDEQGINLTGTLDAEKVPASYRTLIERGWVHYFDCQWAQEHHKAAPLTFGTLQSRLWEVLRAGHYDVKLTADQVRAVKCWIDLNCPLWPDYLFRGSRPATRKTHEAVVSRSLPP